MRSQQDRVISIIVLEAGAGWPEWVAQYHRYRPDTIVEAQPPGEEPMDFAKRVGRRVDELTGRGQLKFAVLVSNGSPEARAAEGRYRIGRAMTNAMAAQGKAELIITTGLKDENVRHELFALAGTLCDDLKGTELSVKVRFSRPPSGS
ncbi:MAG TPA: hypothetical protein VGJ84_16100, partial [Polyangiaceae bacterium]